MPRLSTFLMTAALACATTAPAAAYTLSPPHISAHLHGTVFFHPTGGTPFKCTITMFLKTKGEIKSVSVDPGPPCVGLAFVGLPWRVGILNANTGQFGLFSFSRAGFGGCTQGAIQFQDDASGVWSFPAGQCMTGTLDSHPVVTIVP